MTERLIAYRNNSIREFVYDFRKNAITDVTRGEETQSSIKEFNNLKSELKRQGFRFLPIDPRTHLFNSSKEAEEWCELMRIPMFFTPQIIPQIRVA